MKLLPCIVAAGVMLSLLSADEKVEPSKRPRPVAEEDGVSVYFSPAGGADSAVLFHLTNSQKSIDIAAYSITHVKIAGVIVDAKKRGVQVRVLLDKTQASGKYSSATFFHNMGVATRTDRSAGLMHNKYAIIDSQVVVTGSLNYSKNATNQNAENVLVLVGKQSLTDAYQKDFESLWDKAEDYQPKAVVEEK